MGAQFLLEVPGFIPGQPFILCATYGGPQIGVVGHSAHHFGDSIKAFFPEQHPGAIQGFGYGGSRIRQHGNPKGHAFDQGDAEPFVFAHTEKQVGGPVTGGPIPWRNLARPLDIPDVQVVLKRAKQGIIPLRSGK